MTAAKPRETCRYCGKAKTTDADYDTYKEGEGTHLCWGDYSNPCMDVEAALDNARTALREAERRIADLGGEIERRDERITELEEALQRYL